VLSVFVAMASDYPFDILKLFLSNKRENKNMQMKSQRRIRKIFHLINKSKGFVDFNTV
jgi:hypothetical protein